MVVESGIKVLGCQTMDQNPDPNLIRAMQCTRAQTPNRNGSEYWTHIHIFQLGSFRYSGLVYNPTPPHPTPCFHQNSTSSFHFLGMSRTQVHCRETIMLISLIMNLNPHGVWELPWAHLIAFGKSASLKMTQLALLNRFSSSITTICAQSYSICQLASQKRELLTIIIFNGTPSTR